MNSAMLGLLQPHTHKHTHLTHTQWPVCLRQPFSSIPKPLAVLGMFAIRPHTVPAWEAVAVTRCSREQVLNTCLFISPLYSGLRQETRVTTHPTGCSVLCDTHIPIYQPLTQIHTRTRTKSVSVEAVCQAQEKKLNRPDLLGSKLEQRIMGTLTPVAFWEGSSQSPVWLLSLLV